MEKILINFIQGVEILFFTISYPPSTWKIKQKNRNSTTKTIAFLKQVW